MFIINPYLRFALMALGILGGIALSVGFGFWYGFPFILTGLVLLVGYLLLGTVGSSAQAMQAADFDKAEKLMALTFFPGLLYASNRAYYYMVKGSIALSRKDTEAGEMWLKKAESINVPTDNEKAMLQIQLASLAANKGKWTQAQAYYRTAKQLKITEPTIKEHLNTLEKALQQKGQASMANRMSMGGGKPGAFMQPGGKRKRPKMR